MKKHSSIPLVFVFALSLLTCAAAQAETPPGPPDSGEEMDCFRHRGQGDPAEFFAKKLDALHADLKLNANQEPAWNEWSAKMKAGHPGWKEKRKEFESWANLPAIARMEKRLEFAKQHVGMLEERLAATKTFYATLTDEQKKIFDKQFAFSGHGRGGKWRHQ